MILDEIAAYAKIRVAAQKEQLPLEEIKQMACAMDAQTGFPFEQALKKPDISFICEVKKASPSKGIIAEDFPYLQIAKDYEAAGASAISVLTEPKYFKGADNYLKEIAQTVTIPVLRKDFTVDCYQIYEAKVLGASAVLLICAILPPDTLAEYIKIAHSLGLSAIVEAHTKAEVTMALQAGARIIGVNNRNLKTFEVDMNTSLQLRQMVDSEIIYISESGIRTATDIGKLYHAQVDGVLIGETLMRSADKAAEIRELKKECKER